MRILNIKAQDFKGITLAEVQPNKDTTVIGGQNRAGKSSLLDAIASTLGGAKLCPKEPIRQGQKEARCEIKLEGDATRLLPPCTVIRTWRRSTKSDRIVSELEITTEEGYKAPTPQTILNDIVGPLGFDPERFLRMSPKEQAEVLRNLVGLDFTALDAERQQSYDKRTEVNRVGKTMKARYDAAPHHEDAPAEEVSVAALMTELQRRQAVNRRNDDVINELRDMQTGLSRCDDAIEDADREVEAIKTRLKEAETRAAELRKKKASITGDINVKSVEVNGLADADCDEIQNQIAESETVNRKVRENVERVKLAAELEAERVKSQSLSDRIKAIDEEKQKLREGAKWPVEGLGYDENGVTLLGRPFDQASATEQREAAFGIVAALNPTLRFAMIKDGSLLDDASLADFGRIATEHGFQLFVERVGRGAECSVIISDGEVEGANE